MQEKATSSQAQSQLPLPSFEHVLAFPQQLADEPWPEFVDRVQEWSEERIAKASQTGSFRAVPYHPTLDVTECGLLLKLAWHSFSEGLGRYAPIRLGERAVAALMGDRSTRAKAHAGKALHNLITAGAIEVLEEARGRRPRVVRLCPMKEKPTKEKGATAPPFKKREQSVKEQQPPAKETPDSNLAVEVHATLGRGLPVGQAVKLIQAFGADVVRRQLEWFPRRDTSGFKKGPVVAFRVYCRDDEPAPPEDERTKRERIEREYKAKLDAKFEAEMAQYRAGRRA